MRITDDNIIHELQKHNPDALSWLMNQYAGSVYALIQRILGASANAQDVEECVSDVFAAAWTRVQNYDANRGSIRTWLLILAKFRALDVRRRASQRNVLPPIDPTHASPSSVEDVVIAKEQWGHILLLIDALPAMDKDIFWRRYVNYQSIEEIAQTLGLTRQAVDNRLWRIRKLLKQQLNKLNAEEGCQ